MSLLSWKVVHDGKTPPPGEVVRPDERMSWPRTIGIGVQHVLAMFGATFVLPPIMGIPGTTAIIFSGIATLIFLLIVRNRIPSYLGTSASFVGPAFAVYGGGGDLSEVLFGVLFAGVIFFVVGALVNAGGAARDRRDPAAGAHRHRGHADRPQPGRPGRQQRLLAERPVARAGDAGRHHRLLVFLRGFLRRIAILLAVVVGWALAGLMDALDLGHAQITNSDGTV